MCASQRDEKMGEIKASLILKEHRCAEGYKFSGDYNGTSGVRNDISWIVSTPSDIISNQRLPPAGLAHVTSIQNPLPEQASAQTRPPFPAAIASKH